MPLNNTGPISLGGTTPGQSIAIENSGPGTNQIALNDTPVRTLAGVPSGQIRMPTDFYGKSNIVTLNLTISSDTNGYDVWSNVSGNPSYIAGKTQVTVTVNPGVVVGASSTGDYAMLVPSSFSPGDTVSIVNQGSIVGAGGAGGNGGNSGANSPGSPGGTGGQALYVNRPTTVTNNGTIGSGGGGGGGGGGGYFLNARYSTGGGGGGGGGAGRVTAAGGSGGARGGTNQSTPGGGGNPGSANSGGNGGGGGFGFTFMGGPGGSGGGLGSPGNNGATGGNYGPVIPAGSGGGRGNYIVGNPFVTWAATGTRLGDVS